MKRDHLRSKRRREDNIKIDLQEAGCWDIDWIELAQDKDRRRTLMNLTVSQVMENSENRRRMFAISAGCRKLAPACVYKQTESRFTTLTYRAVSGSASMLSRWHNYKTRLHYRFFFTLRPNE